MKAQRRVIRSSMGSGAGHAFIFLFLLAAAVITLFPIYMAVLNSLKSDGEMLNQVLAWPSSVTFANYADAYEKIDFLRSFVNTVVVTLIGVTGIIVFASMAGYKMSRTPGKLSRFLFSLFVLSSLIPFHSILITLVKIAKELKVQGTTYGLGFIYIGLGVALAIFLYHGFVKSIPRDLDEAAVMDGCGELRLYATIIFPLLLPITATVAILNALWMWNDFLLPLLMLTNSDYYTLLISTNMLFGEYNNDWSAILASLVLTMLPIMAVYLVLQKYILSGIAEGAIKG
ncbi:raffinose/stachyose/melibiose transport system permease protein [Paenibacillus endophyticus]|uniref:Raffinose/stachyose/melibiose transport system permease protein n=1 Tax=Paenibacillus endophyticus TaxID=1294268 RepID=A0A7W5C8M5_9BACL|nr:carbohydrate ABC transporter permease [Paenibacillus endophyticus]MBB3153136.1 raffinose/stachyose/melibiose transport system permease protein [Paenibacillus endophyticus]